MLLEELLGEVFATTSADGNAGKQNLKADDQNLQQNLITAAEEQWTAMITTQGK